jgi:hypothetical protein
VPNPVPVPSSPLSVNADENARTELFVQTLLQLMRAGTTPSGIDSSLVTDPTVFPQAPDSDAAVLLLSTRAQQLFYRQLGLAITKNFTGAGDIVFPAPNPYLEQTFLTTGLTRGAGVYLSSSGTVSQGSCSSDAASLIIGVAESNVANGVAGAVIAIGTLGGVLSGATPNTEYFLGPIGLPVLFSTLTQGQRIIRLGVASSSTDLEVRIADFGLR